MKRLIAILMILALLALPMGGLAGGLTADAWLDALEAGQALRIEKSLDVTLADELGETFALLQQVLGGLSGSLRVQAAEEGLSLEGVLSGRGQALMDLGLWFGGDALYATSRLVSGKVYTLSYEALNALAHQSLPTDLLDALDASGIDPALLLPYITTASSWAAAYMVPVVEPVAPSQDVHPDAVERSTLTLDGGALQSLADSLLAQLLADDALLEAIALQEEGLDVEALRAEIAAAQEALGTTLADTLSEITLELLSDAAGEPVSIALTGGYAKDTVVRDVEIYFDRLTIGDMEQRTVDLFITGTESALRAYLTLEQDADLTDETGTQSAARLLLGTDVKYGERSGSVRLDAGAVCTRTDAGEAIQTELALTLGGPLCDELFQALGMDTAHSFYLNQSLSTALNPEPGLPFITTVENLLSMDAPRIPLLKTHVTVTPEQASAFALPEGAIDLSALSEDEVTSLFFEVLLNLSNLLVEVESVFPELIPEAEVPAQG